MNRFKNQRGDTIVEVLIAIAIVSFVLVLAFALSSHATNTVRDSQEHSEALKLAESQLEQVQASTSGLDTSANNCFGVSGAPASAGDCKFASNGGGTCTEATNGYCYTVRVESSATGVATGSPYVPTLYTVTVNWERLGGGGNKVVLRYRALARNASYVAYSPPVPTISLPPAVADGDDAGVDFDTGGGDSESGTTTCSSLNCADTPNIGAFTYSYTRRYYVTEFGNISAADIASCNWDWGDGTQTILPNSDPGCQKDGTPVKHIFPTDPRYPLSENDCNPGIPADAKAYTVTLTVTRLHGAPKTQSKTILSPVCKALITTH